MICKNFELNYYYYYSRLPVVLKLIRLLINYLAQALRQNYIFMSTNKLLRN